MHRGICCYCFFWLGFLGVVVVLGLLGFDLFCFVEMVCFFVVLRFLLFLFVKIILFSGCRVWFSVCDAEKSRVLNLSKPRYCLKETNNEWGHSSIYHGFSTHSWSCQRLRPNHLPKYPRCEPLCCVVAHFRFL